MYFKVKIEAFNSFGSNFIYCEKENLESFGEVKEAILKRLGNINEMSNISTKTLKEKVNFRKGIIRAKDPKGILHAASLTDRWSIEALEFGDFSLSEILKDKEKFRKDARDNVIRAIVDAELQGKKFATLEIADYYPLDYHDILHELNSIHCDIIKYDDYELVVKI